MPDAQEFNLPFCLHVTISFDMIRGALRKCLSEHVGGNGSAQTFRFYWGFSFYSYNWGIRIRPASGHENSSTFYDGEARRVSSSVGLPAARACSSGGSCARQATV
jgi:hypothetical protein